MTGDPRRRDLHVHTAYCNHAVGGMEEYVEAALHRGLVEIGFLEHIETGIVYPRRTWLTPELLDAYAAEGAALRERYRGRITVSLGVEVGYNPDAPEAVEALVGRHPWDRVAVSYHFVHEPGLGRHLNICSRNDPVNVAGLRALGVREVTRHYYETLAEGVARLRPFMVCHLDVIERNLPSVAEDPDIARRIEHALEVMKETGACLEINTGGYTHLGRLFPSPAILRRALELGIPWVLASDAHAPADVARDFDRALEEIRLLAPAEA